MLDSIHQLLAKKASWAQRTTSIVAPSHLRKPWPKSIRTESANLTPSTQVLAARTSTLSAPETFPAS